jgi:hypothetical protein
VASQLINDKTKTGNILEVVPVSSQKPTSMLQCLTGEPEILNTVSMLSTGGFDLRGQTAKYASGRAVDLAAEACVQDGAGPPAASGECRHRTQSPPRSAARQELQER